MKAILETFVENEKHFIVLYKEMTWDVYPWRLTCIDPDSGEKTFKNIKDIAILETCMCDINIVGKIVWESKVIPFNENKDEG
jgi:hypothetical protein